MSEILKRPPLFYTGSTKHLAPRNGEKIGEQEQDGWQWHTDKKKAKTRRSGRDARARLGGRAHPPTPAAPPPPHPNATPLAPHAFAAASYQAHDRQQGAGRPLPFRLADAACSSRHRQVTAPHPTPRVQAPSGGGRGSPGWLRPHWRLRL